MHDFKETRKTRERKLCWGYTKKSCGGQDCKFKMFYGAWLTEEKRGTDISTATVFAYRIFFGDSVDNGDVGACNNPWNRHTHTFRIQDE